MTKLKQIPSLLTYSITLPLTELYKQVFIHIK